MSFLDHIRFRNGRVIVKCPARDVIRKVKVLSKESGTYRIQVYRVIPFASESPERSTIVQGVTRDALHEYLNNPEIDSDGPFFAIWGS